METLIKALTTFLPLIEQYPTWVKLVVSAWVLFTAVMLVILIVGRQPQGTSPDQGPSAGSPGQGVRSVNVTLQIEEPKKDDQVGPSAIVRGTTTLKGVNLYLVIIPLRTGDRYIVDGPLAIDARGRWSR